MTTSAWLSGPADTLGIDVSPTIRFPTNVAAERPGVSDAASGRM